MTRTIAVIALVLLWSAVTGSFDLPNLAFGLVLAVLVSALVLRGRGTSRSGQKVWAVLRLAGLFVRELLLSALGVAWLALSPNLRAVLKPGIVAVPLRVTSDIEIALLANLITLTPGTLSVDLSADRTTLYVHALNVPDKQRLLADIANGFEAQIMEVFR